MAKRVKRGGAGPIEIIRHHDKRKNIPTEELRDFVVEAAIRRPPHARLASSASCGTRRSKVSRSSLTLIGVASVMR